MGLKRFFESVKRSNPRVHRLFPDNYVGSLLGSKGPHQIWI